MTNSNERVNISIMDAVLTVMKNCGKEDAKKFVDKLFDSLQNGDGEIRFVSKDAEQLKEFDRKVLYAIIDLYEL